MASKKKAKTLDELLEEALVPEEEHLYKLPEDWVWVKLNGFAECLDKFRKPINATERAKRIGDIPYYGATGQVGYIDDYLTDDHLVVLGEDGAPFYDLYKSKSYLIEGKAWVNNHAHLLKSYYGIEGNEYLNYYLNQFNYHGYVSGTTRLKLTQKKMMEIPVPLPPKELIAKIVLQIKTLFIKIEQAQQLIEGAKETFELRRAAILNQLFEKNYFVDLDENKEKGIPYKLPKGWKWEKLSEVGGLKRGKSKHRPRNDKKLFNGPYPFIQTGDVARAEKFIDSYTQTLSEFGLAQSALFEKGTLCITIAANIADTALLSFDSCFPDSVVGFNSNHEYISNEYIHYYISTIKQELEHYAPATAQKNINLKVLNEVLVPVPPKDKYLSIIEVINSLEEKEDFALKEIELEKNIVNLKHSILSKAFKGEFDTNDPNDEPAIELLKSTLQEKL